MNKRWFIGLSVLVAISLLLGGCQKQPTAEEIVAKMREVEADIEDAHAVLEISLQGQGMDDELTIEVWEKKPNRFRAEVLEASDSDLVGAISVTDGHQTWMYHPGQNEVLVGEVGPDEPASLREAIQSVEEMIQRVLDTSEVKLVGEEDVAGVATYKLEFTPKEDEDTILPPGSKATLWVDQERWIVLQAHFIGGVAGEGRMRVRSFEFNAGLADDRFQFEIPEGAQVTNVEDKRPKPITLDEARAQADFTLLVPTYLPEGATLIDVFTVDEAFILHYDHSTTSFTVIQGWSRGMREAPTGQKTEVTVRGQTANLITDGLGNSFLTWMENGVTTTIAGRISQDEILEVAESLQ
jgi:outer membrane lipoprotein-sorting protein